MPTSNRRRFVPGAIECFLGQTYDARELVVLDDGVPVEDVIPRDSCIRYLHRAKSRPHGQKMNLCCRLAKGEVICHWDDDDWSAPTRIEEQVDRLCRTGASVVGYSSMLCFDEGSGRAFEFSYDEGACGTSLCYWRSYWSKHRFLPLYVGSDSVFVAASKAAGELRASAAENVMVFRIHDGNSSPKLLESDCYREIPWTALPKGFRRAQRRVSSPEPPLRAAARARPTRRP